MGVARVDAKVEDFDVFVLVPYALKCTGLMYHVRRLPVRYLCRIGLCHSHIAIYRNNSE